MAGTKALKWQRRSVALFATLLAPACAFWELSDWDAHEGAAPSTKVDSAPSNDPPDADLTDAATAPTDIAPPPPMSFQQESLPDLLYKGCATTFIAESAPNQTGGALDQVSVDDDDPASSFKKKIILMRFDTSSVPQGSKVTGVTLHLNVTEKSSGNTNFELFAISHAWSEANATWLVSNTGVNWATPGAGARQTSSVDRGNVPLASLLPTTTGPVDVVFNEAGRALVQLWVDQPDKNFGFLFDTLNNGDGLFLSSSRAANASADRPKLTIQFGL